MKSKASKNLAKIDIPDIAKAEITRRTASLDNYVAGVVAGLGIKGKWSFDFRSMKIVVGDK